MTTAQFHHALLQGRGTCVLAAREDPEKYREEVLWACRELVSFDTQCEGSRVLLIYELVRLYPDRSPFVRAACDALIACPSDGSWHVSSLAELVELFFQDGDQAAWKALMKKYRQLYHQMRHVGPPEDCVYWVQRDDYERLAVILGWCRSYATDIARDMGRLSLETEWLKDWDFDWFYDTKARRYLRSMTKAAKTDPLLTEFFRVHETAWQEYEIQRAQRRSTRLPRDCRDEERVNAAVEHYLSAVTPAEKIEALGAFHWTAYPADPTPVIRDAQSEHENLHNTAWGVLGDIRHPAVRAFAMAYLQDEEDAFDTFCTNYEKQDEPLLLSHLQSQTIDFEETTGWHGDQLSVLTMDKQQPPAPISALRFIFEHTYCSQCRADALRQLGCRRMLTPELLEECRFDSNDNIRAYARRCLSRRENK